jgi:L-methionine (R)-S-oxide reductase
VTQPSSNQAISQRLQAIIDSDRHSKSTVTKDISAVDYLQLSEQLAGLISDESDRIANLANCTALLWQELGNVNWLGFYLLKRNKLVLGPFQGKPACSRIDMGKGVCGTAAQMLKTIIVADVHQFPGHIACDAASQSEIVLPVISEGKLIAVLDIDSPEVDRFDHHDQQGLELILQTLLPHL